MIGRKTDGQKDRRTQKPDGRKRKGQHNDKDRKTKVDKIYEFVTAAIVLTKENIEPLSLP